MVHLTTLSVAHTIQQRCPTSLYIGAHLTDGCGGAGACGDCNNNNNKVILIKMTTDFIFYDGIPKIF
jgi:hypothetical protein